MQLTSNLMKCLGILSPGNLQVILVDMKWWLIIEATTGILPGPFTVTYKFEFHG